MPSAEPCSSSSSPSLHPSFDEELQATLNFNANPMHDTSDTAKFRPDPVYPISFYDRHLDSKLLLKSIRNVPLTAALKIVCHTNVSRFLSEVLEPRDYEAPYRLGDDSEDNSEDNSEDDSRKKKVRGVSMSCAEDVALHYKTHLATNFFPFPSKHIFHPDSDTEYFWDSVFDFDTTIKPRLRQSFTAEGSLRIEHQARDLTAGSLLFRPEIDKYISTEAHSTLLDLARHSPELAVWEFHPPTSYGKKLLETRYGKYMEWEVAGTTGHLNPSSTTIPPRDGTIAERWRARQRSTREGGVNRKRPSAVVPAKAIRNLRLQARPYGIDYRHYLQRVSGMYDLFIRTITTMLSFGAEPSSMRLRS